MKRALSLFACASLLAACGGAPVATSKKTMSVDGNELQITAGTSGEAKFISVDNTQKTWVGKLEGGKEKWNARRDVLLRQLRNELTLTCGTWFVAARRGPIYQMLDNDETMGGLAPVLGVSVSMVAYLAAEAATKEENIPTGVLMEFDCPER